MAGDVLRGARGTGTGTDWGVRLLLGLGLRVYGLGFKRKVANKLQAKTGKAKKLSFSSGLGLRVLMTGVRA